MALGIGTGLVLAGSKILPLLVKAAPAIGGGLGAVEGYRRGGLLGGVAGGGLGYFTPGAYRWAGSALGKLPVVSGLATKGLQPLANMATKAVGGSAALGPLNTPAILGGAGALYGLSRAGSDAGDLAGEALGGDKARAQREVQRLAGSLPPGVSGNYDPSGLWAYQNPLGAAQAQLGYGADLQDLQARGIDVLSPRLFEWTERTKKGDLERQLAAAKIRANINLASQMAAQGQLGAQALGQQAMGSIGRGITQNYQFG